MPRDDPPEPKSRIDLEQQAEKAAFINAVFSPAAPIFMPDLLSGRTEQLEALRAIVNEKGKHAAIFGERGVGKTSLARVLKEIVADTAYTVYFTCSSGDTYPDIWHGILDKISFNVSEPGVGFGAPRRITILNARDLLAGAVTPHQVLLAMSQLARDRPIVMFIDEFDRIQLEETPRLVGDTIKILSDNGVKAKVVVIGIADNIEELVRHHPSVSRCLGPVHMPVLSESEISRIATWRWGRVGFTWTPSALATLIAFSQGMPHYAQLLGKHMGLQALNEMRLEIVADDFDKALSPALKEVDPYARRHYQRAISSSRPTLHRQVLVSCALATKDIDGTFSMAEVRGNFALLSGVSASESPDLSRQLRDFSQDGGSRGDILHRRGDVSRRRYSFVDALLPPYTLLRARAEGLLPRDVSLPTRDVSSVPARPATAWRPSRRTRPTIPDPARRRQRP